MWNYIQGLNITSVDHIFSVSEIKSNTIERCNVNHNLRVVKNNIIVKRICEKI